mmetsp:Transcript_112810/g.329659  ORF Transcript_112810/g.329659 Transcript_112810/m.329659 type:complete len:299 (+) Transcript_112810:154-1050(+)
MARQRSPPPQPALPEDAGSRAPACPAAVLHHQLDGTAGRPQAQAVRRDGELQVEARADIFKRGMASKTTHCCQAAKSVSVVDRVCPSPLHAGLEILHCLGGLRGLLFLNPHGLASGVRKRVLRSREHLLLVTHVRGPPPGSGQLDVRNGWIRLLTGLVQADHIGSETIPPQRQCDPRLPMGLHLYVKGDGVAGRQNAEAEDAVREQRFTAMDLGDLLARHDAAAIWAHLTEASRICSEARGLLLTVPAHELPNWRGSLRCSVITNVDLEGQDVVRRQYLRVNHVAVHVDVATEPRAGA